MGDLVAYVGLNSALHPEYTLYYPVYSSVWYILHKWVYYGVADISSGESMHIPRDYYNSHKAFFLDYDDSYNTFLS